MCRININDYIEGINNNNKSRIQSQVTSNESNNSIDSTNEPELKIDKKTGKIDELCIKNINNRCEFKERCRYVHGLKCKKCGKNVYHPYKPFEEQIFEHLIKSECKLKKDESKKVKGRSENEKNNKNEKDEDGNEYQCSICLEKLNPYMKIGILTNCNHYFCYTCIKEWRKTKEENSTMIKNLLCPLCKIKSQFVTPSKVIPKDEKERQRLVKEYKQTLSNTECKLLKENNYNLCPFGNFCLYSHVAPDGHFIVFSTERFDNNLVSIEEYENYNANNLNEYSEEIRRIMEVQPHNMQDNAISLDEFILLREQLSYDDGDGYGMHNGVFTNPLSQIDNEGDEALAYIYEEANVDLQYEDIPGYTGQSLGHSNENNERNNNLPYGNLSVNREINRTVQSNPYPQFPEYDENEENTVQFNPYPQFPDYDENEEYTEEELAILNGCTCLCYNGYRSRTPFDNSDSDFYYCPPSPNNTDSDQSNNSKSSDINTDDFPSPSYLDGYYLPHLRDIDNDDNGDVPEVANLDDQSNNFSANFGNCSKDISFNDYGNCSNDISSNDHSNHQKNINSNDDHSNHQKKINSNDDHKNKEKKDREIKDYSSEDSDDNADKLAFGIPYENVDKLVFGVPDELSSTNSSISSDSDGEDEEYYGLTHGFNKMLIDNRGGHNYF